MPKLCVIGFGHRSGYMTSELLKLAPEIKLAAVVDPDPNTLERVKKCADDISDVRHFASVDAWLEEADQHDAVMIGSRCNLHTPLAIKVAGLGIPLFLEKPIAIDRPQLGDLYSAYKDKKLQVVVSFPLRVTPLFIKALEIVRSGRLGTINQIQAVNNVTYGGIYFSEPYREHDLTGGLWLQKATHDFDCLNLLVDSMPTRIAATSTQRIYGGDKPHDLRCSQCDETETCKASPQNLERTGDKNRSGIGFGDHGCVYGSEIRNQDAGSALLEYENRINVTYTQNFATRRGAGRRSVTITGEDGTVDFDWRTEQIRIHDHYSDDIEPIEIKATTGHGGGDIGLLVNFREMIAGDAESISPLHGGLLSAAMCLAADESCRSNAFEDIPMRDEIAAMF
jgi:predicted dehydrogenase